MQISWKYISGDYIFLADHDRGFYKSDHGFVIPRTSKNTFSWDLHRFVDFESVILDSPSCILEIWPRIHNQYVNIINLNIV